ncbi:DNA polymerase III subunit beta [Methylococcaceae bacterium HT1]|nr:DNA polymerase III subunit beta [Methylococcaceae bacterium HT1]TXK96131.1 DNA polymerase III subunit beta [Methylococcaceae bacterium CS4]TXK97790.1 DNA polymerase III subunit beta [Methylococcaceae bacterium CS5]TXL05769.1 DNA polymerase III subunit beta [Methylococcaceae bacterium CS1]TXL08122.1 DNA polymerase III subunit beta [Methylococcaceae bacterium CS3]TXL10309.1 DNA polymerase III subunit beta [Methylococcaceae bacterium CS2]TXL12931.1 DNA polymerase III subunit beta [Methylococc
MRLTEQQINIIRHVVENFAGNNACVTLFGSRVDDTKKGGDIDLLISLPERVQHPAELSAKISAQLIRRLEGRKVDVILSAPNLKDLPIHAIAQQTGVVL